MLRRWRELGTDGGQQTAESRRSLIANHWRSIGTKRPVGTDHSFVEFELIGALERARICSIESSICTSGRSLASGSVVTIAFNAANKIGSSSFSSFSDRAVVFCRRDVEYGLVSAVCASTVLAVRGVGVCVESRIAGLRGGTRGGSRGGIGGGGGAGGASGGGALGPAAPMASA